MRARTFVSFAAVVATLAFPASSRAAFPSAIPSPPLVGAVDFVDGQVGWVETSSSAAYVDRACSGSAGNTARCRQATISLDATNNGGRQWHTVLRLRAAVPWVSADGLPATAIHLFSHTQGYIALADSRSRDIQLRTFDAGVHWVRRPLPVSQAVVSNETLSFPTPADGYFLVHTNGAMQHESVDVYATHDGGIYWRRVESASFDTRRGTPYAVGLLGDKGPMFFLNRPSGWITASDPTGIPYLYATEDQGVTWARQTPPVPHGVPTEAGGRAIAGYGTLEMPTFFSPVAGLLPETLELCRLHASSQQCSFSLYAYHLVDNGRHWAQPQALRRSQSERFRPRWQFVGPTRWFVSFGNTLWSTSDSGYQWRLIPALLPRGLVLSELSFLGASRGFAIGAAQQNAQGYPSSAGLLRTMDSGHHWERVNVS